MADKKRAADEKRLCVLLTGLFVDALQYVAQSRIVETVERWRMHVDLSDDAQREARRLADAVGLASDLALFMPSPSGATAIDRMARHRKPADRDEAAAVAALRQARWRVMRIEERQDQSTLRFRDLASGETLRVIDEDIPPPCMGVSLVGRTAPLGEGSYALVGPATPLDEAALAVARSFMRPDGKGLTNAQRCAEAVYRQLIRHGGPELVGLNRPLDDASGPDDPGLDPDEGTLDGLVQAWARQGADVAPDPAAIQRVRDLTHLDSLVAALGGSAAAREQRHGGLADAYARIAAIQIETIQLRQANGIAGLSLQGVSAALADAIASHRMPPGARSLFEELVRRSRPAASAGDGNGNLERLVQRIQGLRAKTVEQGCTEEEALAAAEKVAELLDRYGLSLSEIELRRQTCLGIGIDTDRRRLRPIDECVPVIAAFFDCRTWSQQSGSAPIRHVFFGLRADVTAAHYLYDLVERAFTTETARFARNEFYLELGSGERRSATNSFQIGLARGIAGKLQELRKERDAALASSGRDLVPIKSAVIEEDLARLGLHFRARNRASGRSVMTGAYEAGHAAGTRFEYRPGLAAAE
ncbi:MAG: DUF2786 domain-containing protein [Acidisphaera sp.]|nr:DUF2786 domain-containing protein [Acidisphaera sp.]